MRDAHTHARTLTNKTQTISRYCAESCSLSPLLSLPLPPPAPPPPPPPSPPPSRTADCGGGGGGGGAGARGADRGGAAGLLLGPAAPHRRHPGGRRRSEPMSMRCALDCNVCMRIQMRWIRLRYALAGPFVDICLRLPRSAVWRAADERGREDGEGGGAGREREGRGRRWEGGKRAGGATHRRGKA